jgi:integrase
MKKDQNLVQVPAANGKPAHYITEITLNYRRVRRFAGYTKAEALQFLAELHVAAKEGRLDDFLKPEKPKDTFGEYARAVLDSAEWRAKRSAERNETSFLHLSREFKDYRLGDIKPAAVRRYVTRRIEEDGAAPASTNRELSLLKCLLNMAEADELIPANPIRGKRVKKQVENNNREKTILDLDLSDEKLRLLIEKAAEYLKLILKLAMTTGLRRDEILRTKWRDVSFETMTVRIPAENAKSKKERIVPLPACLCDELDALPRKSEYAFVNPETGERRKDIREGFAVACREAGIPTGRKGGLVFHDLRHIAAYRLVKETDVVTASKILGHSTLDMTLRYVHPTERDKRAAVEKAADRLLNPVTNPVNPEKAEVSEGLVNRIHVN